MSGRSRNLPLFLTLAALATVSCARLAEAQASLHYTPLTACRLYDSRSGQPSALGSGGGAITTTTNSSDPASYRPLRVRGACGIPTTAVAVSLNHTMISPSAPGGTLARMCADPMPSGQTTCFAWVQSGAGVASIAAGGTLPLGVISNPGIGNDIQLQGIGADSTGHQGVYTYDWIIDVHGYFQ